MNNVAADMGYAKPGERNRREASLDQRLGIIGGGQLGKMMILEAKRLGIYCAALDPDPLCPAHSIADEMITAGFDDVGAVVALARRMDAVTFELEHVGRDCLASLASVPIEVAPAPSALMLIQNKHLQKKRLLEASLPVPSFVEIESRGDLSEAGGKFGYPYMLKTAGGGYDGKGNILVESPKGALNAFEKLNGRENELIAEEFIAFVCEISVLLCRGSDGEVVTYPIAENTHEDSILIETIAPARISDSIAECAQAVARRCCDLFKITGMMCVEMFVTDKGGVLINEIAPRPHNSGHYTIDACVTNQFENHVRAVAGLPLGDTSMRGFAVMRNLLGADEGRAVICGAPEALSVPKSKLHIYGKQIVRERRKMGHVTCVGDDLETARTNAARAAAAITITKPSGARGK